MVAGAPPGLRERRKRDTRRALESAALRLFARDGFDATTVEAIAAEAKVSGRTFFRYFAAKDEVVYVERRHRQALVRAELLAAPPELGDLAAIRDALVVVAPQLDADRDLVLLQQQASARSVVLRGRLFDVLLSWEQAIARALAERRDAAAPGVAHEAAAATAMAAYRLAVGRWLDAPPPSRPLAAHLDDAFAALGLRS